MARQTKRTIDHQTIKEWAESRDGKPSIVTENGERIGVIKLDFPDSTSENFQEVHWDEWFRLFEKNELKLIYQDETKAGERSNFNKLISRKR